MVASSLNRGEHGLVGKRAVLKQANAIAGHQRAIRYRLFQREVPVKDICCLAALFEAGQYLATSSRRQRAAGAVYLTATADGAMSGTIAGSVLQADSRITARQPIHLSTPAIECRAVACSHLAIDCAAQQARSVLPVICVRQLVIVLRNRGASCAHAG